MAFVRIGSARAELQPPIADFVPGSRCQFHGFVTLNELPPRKMTKNFKTAGNHV